MTVAIKLSNFACELAGRCLPLCGMCENPNQRKLTPQSLFGICREVGECVDGICHKIAREMSGSNIRRGRRRGMAQVGPKNRERPAIVHMQHCYNNKTLELVCTPGFRLCDPVYR